jgi:hypothetical protein
MKRRELVVSACAHEGNNAWVFSATQSVAVEDCESIRILRRTDEAVNQKNTIPIKLMHNVIFRPGSARLAPAAKSDSRS